MAPGNPKQPNGRCVHHSGLDARVTNVEADTKDQWMAINKIMNRPPVWATVVISLLTFLVGLLVRTGGFGT